MKTTTFELTELERACGVTETDLKQEIPRIMIRDYGNTAIIDGTLPPALSNALARFTLGDEYTYAGFNKLGLAIYRR